MVAQGGQPGRLGRKPAQGGRRLVLEARTARGVGLRLGCRPPNGLEGNGRRCSRTGSGGCRNRGHGGSFDDGSGRSREVNTGHRDFVCEYVAWKDIIAKHLTISIQR